MLQGHTTTYYRCVAGFCGLVSEKKGILQYKANTKHEILVVFCNILGSAGEEEISVMNAFVFFSSADFFVGALRVEC